MDGLDPAEIYTREQLRAALAEVKARSRLSLTKIADRSRWLAQQNRSIGSTGHRPVKLSKSNISGFTGGSRSQLPSEAAMVTFLVLCRTPVAELEAWRTALRRARTSRGSGEAPILPRLPDHFVPRPTERRQLVEELRALAERGGGAIGLASTAALHGTGGFGKTTLALDVCRVDAVRALFPDGIVWIEVGQEPVLIALLADVTARILGRPPIRFGSVNSAAAAMAEALANRRVLLVLDNVWRAADLEPFLRGGSDCVRLITSRRADVLPAGATILTVDRMEPAQAIALLGRGVPGVSKSALFPLYERSHRWPVVLGILNGVLRARSLREATLPLEQVVAGLSGRLDSKGLTGADDLADTQVRTAREVLAIGVQDLAADANGTVLRDRFLSLAAFPPDQLIGFDTLTELWDCDGLEARAVCDRLADRSLLGSVERLGVRLHDVIRDHLVFDHHPPIKGWAERLLAIARGHCADERWDLIPDAHADALDRLAFLLVFTNSEDELRDLLLDLRFMVRRIRQGGIAGLAADLSTCEIARGRDPQLHALSRIIELEGHLALRVDGAAGIAGTLWARLTGDPVVRDLVTHRDEALADALVPMHPMPDRPDRRLTRVFSGHADRVIAMSWQPDGAKLATGSADGVVRIWDEAGSVLRTVELEAAVNALAWSPDNVHLAALVGESTVCLIEPILGDVTGRFDADKELTCLVWTPSGLAVGRGDGAVLVWEAETDQVTRPRTTSDAAVRAMQWAGGELGLVLAHSDGTVARLGDGPPADTQTGLNVPRALTVRPGRTETVVGAATNGLVLVEMAATPPRVIATSEPTFGWITSAEWSHDGTWLAAGLQDGAVALWSTTRDGVRNLSSDMLVRAWEDTLAVQPPLNYHGQRVAALTWHPRLPLLAVAAQTDARIFDLRRDPDSATHPGINCLRRHPRRNLFAAGGMDGELIIFHPAGPAARHTFEAHDGAVRSVAFSPSDERLLTITEQGPILLWDIRDVDQGEITATSVWCPVRLPGAAAWSPDGALVAVGGDKQVVMLDPQQQLEELRRFDVPNLVNGLDFDPSGSWIAVATSGSDIGVYSTAGEPARRLTSHMSSVGSVRWVDNRYLASAGYDGQVIIWSPWDEATDGVLRRIDPGGGAVWDIAVSRTAIVTVTSAGLLGLHALRLDGPNCIIALDTALSSCDVSANGMALAVGGSAGTFLFSLPNWAAGTRVGSAPSLDDRPARRGHRA